MFESDVNAHKTPAAEMLRDIFQVRKMFPMHQSDVRPKRYPLCLVEWAESNFRYHLRSTVVRVGVDNDVRALGSGGVNTRRKPSPALYSV
jgi:hypothetical protein